MSDLREAAQQVLEALERYQVKRQDFDRFADEVTALRVALAQPAASGEPAEPVAYRYRIRRPGGIEGETWHLIGSPGQRDATSASLGAPAEPLYTAQPAPAPLTDEQINQITAEQWGAGLGAPYAAYRAYARAVEAAHGITATQESLREHMAEVQRLRAALAQPATIAEWWAAKQAASGEPVAWIQPDHLQKAKRAPFLCRVEPTQRCADFVPLYTAQPAPARVPLTDEQVFDSQEFMHLNGSLLQLAMPQLMLLVRCIERAHGITAKEAP